MSQRRKIFLGIIAPVVAVILFAVFAHFRAKAMAERFKAQLRAQGEKLTIVELVPLPPISVPNGARDFLDAQSRLTSFSYEIQPGAMKMVRPGRARIAWKQPALPADKSSNIWPALRAYFETNQTALADLRAALGQPVLHFQVNYQQGFSTLLPHLAKVKVASQTLSAAALTAMRDQRTDEAFANLQALVELPARYREEPFMISQLVRYAIVAIAVSAAWEALHYPYWREEQLAQLQAACERLDVLTDMDASLGMERACVLEEYSKCRDSLNRFYQLNNFGGGVSNPIEDIAAVGNKIMENPAEGFEEFLDSFPRRWVWKWWNCYEDEIWFLQHHHSQMVAARHLVRQEPFVPLRDEVRAESGRIGDPPKQFLVARMLGTDLYFKQVEKAAIAETQRRIVVTAIALKRFERRHGGHATSLSALVPEFLPAIPLDPMDGQSLRYRLTGDNSFLLYSVGSDGKDGGGDVRPPNPNSKSLWWTMENDWVWPAPATDDEVSEFHEKQERGGKKRK